MDDAERLFKWRNDPETRKNSRNTEPIDFKKHMEWLRASLENPQRKIYIAEDDGVSVGVVRSDLEGDLVELSWTIAPEARGRGLGKEMLLQFRKEIIPHAKIRASVRKGNVASEKIAAALGLFPSDPEKNFGEPPMIAWK